MKHRLDVRPVEAADPLVGRWLAYLAQSRERTLGVLEDLSAEGSTADAVDAASDEHPQQRRHAALPHRRD